MHCCTEITDLKSAISELQKAVQDGKYVTAVSGNGNVITFTFTDGSTTPITVETESGEASQTVTIGEDGEVIINGEGTGYYTTKTPTEAEVEAGLVKKGANGTWEVLGENGEYTDTKIPVSGISVSGSVAEGYTFTIVDANGKTQEVKLPSAASAITSIDAELIGNTNAGEEIDGQVSKISETISINEYNFDTESNKKRWKDLTDKDITSNKAILTSANVIAARINPVSAEATQVNFSLTNSKNETLPNVIFKATEYKNYVTDANVGSRADYGNGLYTLGMQSLEAKDKGTVQNTFKLTTGENNEDNILYALNAQNACRGDYQFAVNVAYDQIVEFEKYIIAGDKDNLVSEGAETDITEGQEKAFTHKEVEYTPKLDAKVAHSVAVYDDMSEIYDMWLTAEDYDVELFDLTFDQEKHTFTVNADPDIITKANFTLTVHTLDNNGIYRAQPIVINVSNKIVADADYATREWGIVDDEGKTSLKNKNAFFADMKTMTDGLGSQLAAWQRKVNGFTVEYFTDADCKNAVENASKADVKQEYYYENGVGEGATVTETNNSGIDLIFVNANRDKEVPYKDAVDMKFAITNANASDVFSVDKVYYARVTFYDGKDALNSIVVPFEFSIPELSSLFAIRDGYVVDGVINAYFYQAPAQEDEAASTAVALERYFSKYVPDAELAFDGKIGDKESKDLFAWGTADANGNSEENNTVVNDDETPKQLFAKLADEAKDNKYTTLDFTANTDNDGIDDKGQAAGAYGEAVTIKVTKDNYFGWAYQADGADKYSFQIRLMSPVYEGSIKVLTGDRVIVSANDFVHGANITEKDIEGRDYTGVNNLYIFPDKIGDEGKKAWENEQIWDVTPGIDKDHYIDDAVMTPVTTETKDGTAVITANGVINIKGRSVSKDTNIDLPVTIKDAWGYKLNVNVPVTVKVGE